VPDLARLYDHHAEDCIRSAEKIDNPNHRAMLLKAAAEWRQAAQARRQTDSRHKKQPPSQKLQAPASHTKRPGRGPWPFRGKASYGGVLCSQLAAGPASLVRIGAGSP